MAFIGLHPGGAIQARQNDPLLVNPAKVKLPPYYPESPVIRRDVARMYSNIMEMDKQVGVMLKELGKVMVYLTVSIIV